MSNGYVRYVNLVTPGLYREIQCREYPPHKKYLIKPPPSKIAETNGQLPDQFFAMTTDENGFINPQHGQLGRDPTIVFLGGSTTECIWNSEEQRWPNQVAAIYNSSYPEVAAINTINSGVWGNTTAQSINLLFNKILPLKPAACGLMHNINDLVLMIHEQDYWHARIPSRNLFVRTEFDGMTAEGACKRIIGNALKRSWQRLFRFTPQVAATDEFAALRQQQSRLDSNTFEQLFSDNLRIFCNICTIKGIMPILLTQASRLIANGDPEIVNHVSLMMDGKGLSYDDVCGYYQRLNQCVRDVAAELQVPLIDLDRAIPKTREMMFDSVHFTDLGCERVADYVAEQLRQTFAPAVAASGQG